MSFFTLELLVQNGGPAEVLELPVVSFVHSRIERFIYADDIDVSSIPLDYIESKTVSPTNNLQIVNRSQSLVFNSSASQRQQNGLQSIVGSKIISDYANLLITNQTVVDSSGVLVPLWYKHKLPVGTTGLQFHTVTNNTKAKEELLYRIDEQNSVIYTNFKNWYDYDKEEYVLHYVSGSLNNGEGYNSLLNTEPTANEIQWDDLEQDGSCTTRYPAYGKEYNAGTYTFNLNSNTTWYWKPGSGSLIEPLLPMAINAEDSWWLRISNGDISGLVSGNNKRYWVPEFYTQPFNPGFPYKFSSYSRTLILNESTVAINRENIYVLPSSNLHLELWVLNHEEELVRIYTTDKSKEGQRYSDTSIFYDSTGIASWDNDSGVIALAKKLQPSWKIIAKHFYRSSDIELTGIDLNPVFNTHIRDKTVVCYCVPEASNSQRAIHYLIVDQDGIILDCSQGPSEVKNLQLLNQDTSYNIDTVIGLKYSSIIDTNFIDLYSALGTNPYGYLIIAEIGLRVQNDKAGQVIVDVRRPGNSIRQEHVYDALLMSPLLANSMVYGHEQGLQLPFNKVLVADVPVTLLSDYGGIFSVEQVQSLLHERLESGTYLSLNWKFIQPQIDVYSEVATEVDITCSWEGPNLTYKLWKRTNPTDEWVLEDTVINPPEADVVFNEIETSDTVVYYCISIVADNIELPKGNSVAVKVR